ncbi:MAG: tetratricopeptide repeat protein [Pseudomonadota bacterium]|nr:tetratricopeptide repeat protein [Pseudomonadota bacterium]
MRSLHYIIGLLALTLSGCASVDLVESPVETEQVAPTAAKVEPSHPYADIPGEQLSTLLQAEFAIRERNLDAGLMHLMKASQAIPDPAIARRALQLAQYIRNPDATLAMAVRASDLDPSDGSAATLAAAVLIERGDIARALTYSRRAFDAGSDINPAALLNSYEGQTPETQTATRNLLEALESDYPEDARSLFAIALLEWRQGNSDVAVTKLDKLFTIEAFHERGTLLLTEILSQADDPDAFDPLLKAIEATNSSLLRYQYARYLLGKQKLTEAKAQFDVLVADPAATVDHLIGAAVLDIELSDSASALLHLNRALPFGQRMSDAQFFKALALIQLNDISGALKALGEVGPSTNYGRALQEAAAILVSQGDIGAANAFFEGHRQVHADGAELNFALHAETLQTLGSIEAESVLSRGIDAFPTSTRLLFARANFRERAGFFDLAEADYRRILSLNPGDANALNALGYALTNNTDRFQEAAGLLEEAISKDPRNPAIIDSLGWVYFKLGKDRQAELLLKEAYKQYPDPEVAAHLIELLWTQGREIEARDLIANQWRASPNNEHLRETASRLAIPLPE